MIRRAFCASPLRLVGIFLLFGAAGVAQQFTISTVAGNGLVGYWGDGGQAAAAVVRPYCIATDAAGNYYISDWIGNAVREVTANGVINTIAGNGTLGYSGDGGPATSAQLNTPCGVVVDPAGDIYIADTGNDVVREVTPDGNINTIAGNNTRGYSGDGSAPASAQLYSPTGLALDAAGNLYISDCGNNVIRVVTPGAGTIFTLAGNIEPGYSGDGGPAGNAQFSYPKGLAMDSSGNLYIADFGNSAIRKITPGGTITTIAGNGTAGYFGDGGPAASAELSYPISVAADSSGNVFIADTSNQRVREVQASGTIVTVAGDGTPGYAGDGGPSTGALLNYPGALAVNSQTGGIYIGDWDNNVVRLLTPLAADSRDVHNSVK